MPCKGRDPEFFKAYQLGLGDRETAKILGVPCTTYQHWRYRNKLTANRYRFYRPSKLREQITLTKNGGVPMKTAIVEPEQQEKMTLFLRLAVKCRPENISKLVIMIHKDGFEMINEALKR